MDLEAIKNMKYIFKQVITWLKKLCAALNTFFLFKDWVLVTQLRIRFLTLNTGVWNQLLKFICANP